MTIVRLKNAIFLLIMFLIISSKLFAQTILKQIPQTLEYDMPTEKGLFISGLLLSISYILIDILVQNEIL